jgi:hypothetical protein
VLLTLTSAIETASESEEMKATSAREEVSLMTRRIGEGRARSGRIAREGWGHDRRTEGEGLISTSCEQVDESFGGAKESGNCWVVITSSR